jgi:hypothetical protein
MDPRDKDLIARKLRRKAEEQGMMATELAQNNDLDENVLANVKYEVHIGIKSALISIALDLEGDRPPNYFARRIR